MSKQELKTHLYDYHAQHGKLVSFADFKMPIWYKGIIPEHLAVRNSVGIFDVTHMGRVTITGTEAETFLNYVTTNDVSTLEPMSAHYTVMCNERGGIKDDFVLSRQDEETFFLVYNAANRQKNFQWLTEQASRFSVKLEDVSDDIAMFAVQGPKAQHTLQKIASTDLSTVKKFKCGWTRLAGFEAFVSRTGYTGEDGFEVFVLNTPVSSPDKAVKAWNAILDAGRESAIEPCGLGARDTLRLETGMCLYGSDITEDTSPLEARIGFVVKLQKPDFIGKDALLKQKADGIKRTRIGLKMLNAGIPRPKHEVFKDGETIGYITSGTFSPLLKCGVAMAYVPTDKAKEGDLVSVKIRDKQVSAQVSKFPLYDSSKYGSARTQ